MKRLLFGLALLPLVACAKPTVIRVIDGVPVEGRFISERAYALYARAADAEAHGDLTFAQAAYEAAWEDDPDSAELATRIGAMRCGLAAQKAKGATFEAADEAFEQALARDAAYEPTHHEIARCALLRGRPDRAMAPAMRALALDPDRVETALLAAKVLEANGRVPEARRMLLAITARDPSSTEAMRATIEHATRHGDEALATLSRRKLARVDPDARATPGEALRAIDAALAGGDLRTARRLSLRAHLPSADLAARAAGLGKIDAARAIGGLVVDADPSSATARIALAVAADLAGDPDAVARALTLGGATVPPSSLARLLYAELLMRRVGDGAARAWLGGWMPADAADDVLLARVAARVRARLQGS